MDLTKEILFNDVSEFEAEFPENEESIEEVGVKSELLSLDLEANEIVIEHGLDTIIVNISKLKDLTLRALLTKFKDNLSIVPKISGDFLTVLENNKEVNLEHKVTEGNYYLVYSEHQIKG